MPRAYLGPNYAFPLPCLNYASGFAAWDDAVPCWVPAPAAQLVLAVALPTARRQGKALAMALLFSQLPPPLELQ